MSKIILNWQFDFTVEQVPGEPAKEIFIVGTPGKIPMSIKIPDAKIGEMNAIVAKAKIQIKKMFLESIMRELAGEVKCEID